MALVVYVRCGSLAASETQNMRGLVMMTVQSGKLDANAEDLIFEIPTWGKRKNDLSTPAMPVPRTNTNNHPSAQGANTLF